MLGDNLMPWRFRSTALVEKLLIDHLKAKGYLKN
jgi:hypothetical protein